MQFVSLRLEIKRRRARKGQICTFGSKVKRLLFPEELIFMHNKEKEFISCSFLFNEYNIRRIYVEGELYIYMQKPKKKIQSNNVIDEGNEY